MRTAIFIIIEKCVVDNLLPQIFRLMMLLLFLHSISLTRAQSTLSSNFQSFHLSEIDFYDFTLFHLPLLCAAAASNNNKNK
jgi:hypothetical protein